MLLDLKTLTQIIKTLTQIHALAKAIDELSCLSESLDIKLDKLLQSELGSACLALQEARHSQKEVTSLLRESRDAFRKALFHEKHERLTIAYLGLAMCHFQLGDEQNGVRTLRDFVKAHVAPSWTQIAQAWYFDQEKWAKGVAMGGPIPIPFVIPVCNPALLFGSEGWKENMLCYRAARGKLRGPALELFTKKQSIESIQKTVQEYLRDGGLTGS